MIWDSLIRFYAKIQTDKSNKKHKTRPFKPENVDEYTDIPYESRDGYQLFMNIFKPEEWEHLPVVITVHGGGLFMGDRNLSLGFCYLLAQRGFIVCALEYRLVPSVRMYEEVADVSAGMDYAIEYVSRFNADTSRIYIASESAGAYLCVYANAAMYSPKLAEAIGYKPANIKINAMALVGGMFYTDRLDRVRVLSGCIYGNDERKKKIKDFISPEHPDIAGSMPPSLIITSKEDFLRTYSESYIKVLQANNIDSAFRNMGDDPRLKHAFPMIHPDYPESGEVMDLMADWFNKHK